MLSVEVPVDSAGFTRADDSSMSTSAAGEDPGNPLVATPTHERRLVRSDSAKVPIELEDALRLQNLGRLMHRLHHKDVANSPRRRAMVEQYRRDTVMGTGVAERKVLGMASKDKIDEIIASGRYYEEAFGRDSKHYPATGLRRTATYGKVGALGLGSSDRANGIGVDYTDGALAFKAKDHRPIAKLGVTTKTKPAEHSRLCELVAPEAPPLPQDRGWSIMGKNGRRGGGTVGGFGDGVTALPGPEPSPSSDTPGIDTRIRPDDRRDSAYLRSETVTPTSNPGPSFSSSGVKGDRDGDGDGDEKSAPAGTPPGTEPGSVLATLYGAGESVRGLSLAERKALFEVGVQEHVSALTELLFPEEDGVSPTVNIDVSV